MIIIKHTKHGSISYVSHVDTMRVILRSLIRTGVEIAYSEGFNPHPLVNLSHPLPLGVESECEYVCVNNLSMDKDTLFQAFNRCAPEGIRAVYALEVVKNPNVAGKVAYADYYIKGSFDAIKPQADAIMQCDKYEIKFMRKNAEVIENIRPMIKSIAADGNGITTCLATGNPTLRPDRLCEHFNREFGTNIGIKDITRVCQYVIEDGEMLDMDSYIRDNFALPPL